MRNAQVTRNTLSSVVRAAALALVLLAAEAFVVVHPFDLDAHSGGEPCKICISVVGLDSGAAARIVTLALDTATPVAHFSFARAVGRPLFLNRFARGPPAAS